MTIDPKTLPDGAAVSIGLSHGNRFLAWVNDGSLWEYQGGGGECYGSLDVIRAARAEARVFVPVPDGVTYDDALRAVQDARPWVRVERPTDALIGKVVRVEGDCGITHEGELNGWGNLRAPIYLDGSPMGFDGTLYAHPDDVPDPDADLIAHIATAFSDEDGYYGDPSDKHVAMARAALAAIRKYQP